MIGISIAVIDISERKVAEDALQESVFLHQHMAAICGNVPWSMDRHGKDLQVGSVPSAVAGSDDDAAQHPEWLGDIHPEDRDSTIRAMRSALRSKQPLDVEYRVMIAERGWRWVRCRASPRLGAKGEVLRWYGGVEDVDELKRTEQELSESRAALTALTDVLSRDGIDEATANGASRVPVRRATSAT